MNESVNRELLEDLRSLAADGPHAAPDQIEQRLVEAFRARRFRRNAFRWTSAVGAAAAVLAVGLWFSHAPKGIAVPVEEDSAASFYPLPEAEALPVMENAMVVRVELPVSSLRLMGVPVSEEEPDSSVQAELLLGQDGLARGVRLAE